MTMRTAKLAWALAGALAMASPLALGTTAVQAAPRDGGMMIGGGMGHLDAMHDRNHRPPARTEHRPRQPHGHYRWRDGAWNWQGNQWVWAPGLWVRF